MRQIIHGILASPVPVAAFAAPIGARPASAGTYILYASHIAVMAPGTNLGAATPVRIDALQEQPRPAEPEIRPDAGADSRYLQYKVKARKEHKLPLYDTMFRKAAHDAAAYVRSLAQLRGRNAG